MKKIRTTIKYDGAALANKSMDVADLMPSLLALSDLIKIANHQFNGEKSAVKVLVNANLEQHCFELFVEGVQSFYEKTLSLIGTEQAATVKNLFDWTGITKGVAIGLYGLIRFLNKKKIESATMKPDDGAGNGACVVIKIEGDNNVVTVPAPVYQLYQNRAARACAIKVLSPLEKDGYDSVEFYNKKEVYEKFTDDDFPTMDDLPEVNPQNVLVSNIRTTVRIRKAVFEGKAKWTVVYKRAIEASIDDEAWLIGYQNGTTHAPPLSSLDIDLEETAILNDDGIQIDDASYRIVKVHGVKLPLEQNKLF